MAGNSGQQDRYNHIENEFDHFENFRIPKAPNKVRDAQLYKFLHLTRAADTSLCLIVEALGVLDDNRHMRGYLNRLTSRGLHSNDRDKFVSKVVYERNKYVHVADQYITKQQINMIEPIVYEMLMCALNCR